MSAIVSSIITETKNLIAAKLGAGYQEIRYVFDVSKNDIRTAEKAYGVRPLSADEAASVTKSYTVDHGFEIILSDTFARGHDDRQREEALGIMYDKADEIFKLLINTKINLPNVVLNINGPNISEPEFFDENKILVLRVGITIKYRNALDS